MIGTILLDEFGEVLRKTPPGECGFDDINGMRGCIGQCDWNPEGKAVFLCLFRNYRYERRQSGTFKIQKDSVKAARLCQRTGGCRKGTGGSGEASLVDNPEQVAAGIERMAEYPKLTGCRQGSAQMETGQTGLTNGLCISSGCGDQECFVQEDRLLDRKYCACEGCNPQENPLQ